MDSVFDQHLIEINEQAERELFQAQVRYDLCSVNRKELVNRLQFQKQFFLYDGIGPEADFDEDALVTEMNRNLTLMLDSPQIQFVAQAGFISAFEQAWAEFPMNGKHRINNCSGEALYI